MSILRKSIHYHGSALVKNSPNSKCVLKNNAFCCFSKSILQYLSPYLIGDITRFDSSVRMLVGPHRYTSENIRESLKFLKLVTFVSTFYWTQCLSLFREVIDFFKENSIDMRNFFQTDMSVELTVEKEEDFYLISNFDMKCLYLNLRCEKIPHDCYLNATSIIIELDEYNPGGFIGHTRKYLRDLEIYCITTDICFPDVEIVNEMTLSHCDFLEPKHFPVLKKIGRLEIKFDYGIEFKKFLNYDIDVVIINGHPNYDRCLIILKKEIMEQLPKHMEIIFSDCLIDIEDVRDIRLPSITLIHNSEIYEWIQQDDTSPHPDIEIL